MTLEEYLLKKTEARTLVMIRDCGWVRGTAWIDHEDLFIHSLSHVLLGKRVKNAEWGTMDLFAGKPNYIQTVKVLFIDV